LLLLLLRRLRPKIAAISPLVHYVGVATNLKNNHIF
jgi:hypothetical protein